MMEPEFSLENERPLNLIDEETLFDIPQELANISGQRARDLREVVSEWNQQNRVLKMELDRFQKSRQQEQCKVFISFAKEYFQLQKILKKMQDQNLDKQFPDYFEQLVDISVHLEEIFQENQVEIEDPTGQPVNRERYDIQGVVTLPGFGAGIVVEAFSPVIWLAGQIIHRAQVMISQ